VLTKYSSVNLQGSYYFENPDIDRIYKQMLMGITKLFCPETISNEHLWQIAEKTTIIKQIKDRK
jgi:hypothetical protein